MFRSLPRILATVALAAMVAACSGAAGAPGVASLDDPDASGAPGSSPSASAEVTPQDAMLAYARCMRENGVDMPDPVVSTDGEGRVSIDQGGPGEKPVSKDELLKAEEACRHHMAAARLEGKGPTLSAEDMDKMLAFARCMREHGIPMEDPSADGGIRIEVRDDATGSGGDGPSVNEDELGAAHEACASHLPGKLGKPGLNSGGGKPDGGGFNGAAPDPAESN
jgi:hypothetical protein